MSRREISSTVFRKNTPGYYGVEKLALLLKIRLSRIERVPTGSRRAEVWFAMEPPAT